ncbi:MAG TPA: flagellar assembly protein FliW [Clostridiales bacterium]|nr:flagellar assembly protein FliW [Clostridiales bacterium]
MVIETVEFGHVEINEEDIIHFPEGIYGIEAINDYVFLERNDLDVPIIWMQAVHNKHIRFVVFDPLFIVDEYQPEIPDDILGKLGAKSLDNLKFFVIAVVPKNIEDMTVNLKSPIVVNFETKKAYQVILENSDYSVRHFVFRDSGVAE